MEKTFCGTAVLRADVSAERFLLHWYLPRLGTGQATFVTSAACGPFCPCTISNST
jgi:hypothetical protein